MMDHQALLQVADALRMPDDGNPLVCRDSHPADVPHCRKVGNFNGTCYGAAMLVAPMDKASMPSNTAIHTDPLH